LGGKDVFMYGHGHMNIKPTLNEVLDALPHMSVNDLIAIKNTLANLSSTLAYDTPMVYGKSTHNPGPMNYHLLLLDAGNSKIQCIKEVRALTNLGLKEAKDLVDTVPQIVLHNVDQVTAYEGSIVLGQVGSATKIVQTNT
jgi:ribosomal protein L7/L12